MWFEHNKHSSQTRAAILGGFPSLMSEDVELALRHIGKSKHKVHCDHSYSSFSDSHKVKIPYRVYFPPVSPQNIKRLPELQRAIVASIMSRHHDGLQREIWIRELCQYPAGWAVPYIAYALGDYVVEVVSAIEVSMSLAWIELFHSFKTDLYIDSFSLSQRIFTYWAIYYGSGGRRYIWLEDHSSYRVANTLGVWDKRVGRQIIRKHNKRAQNSTDHLKGS